MKVVHKSEMVQPELAQELRTDLRWSPLDPATIKAWSDFSEQLNPANFFVRPCVLAAWQKHLARDPEFGLLLVWRDTALVGVMPLMRRFAWRSPTLAVRYDYDPYDRIWLSSQVRKIFPLRQLGPVISLPATMIGPVFAAAPQETEAVIGKIAEVLARTPRWDMSVLPLEENQIAIWQDKFREVGLKTAKQTLDRIAYTLCDTAPLAELIERQPRKRRQNSRRALSAGEKAEISYRVMHDAAEIAPILKQLADQSWKADGRPGENTKIPYAGSQQAFIEGLILGPDRQATVACVAEQNGLPVAIVLGVVYGKRLITLLTFWDGSNPNASPGMLVMGNLIAWAHEQGLDYIDFNSGAPWLKAFADTVLVQNNLIVFGPSLWSKVLRQCRHLALFARDKLSKSGEGADDPNS